MTGIRRLGFAARLDGVAGPASFQRRLADGLRHRGIGVGYGLEDRPFDAVLVIGGSRRLGALARLRREGVPIIQRLDGMNWLHRRRPTGLGHFLRAELNNLLVRLVRGRLATAIVYQSEFARGWWERVHGRAPAPAGVVHNGVPLDRFSPQGPGAPPDDRWRLLMVEGNLAGGYELGLEWGSELARRVAGAGRPVELLIAGAGAHPRPDDPAAGWTARALGVVDPAAIPELDRSAHLLFSADLQPACPNSVIEALACGLPVVAFRTGALPELVTAESGRLADYGSDPWRAGPPDFDALAAAALAILAHQPAYRRGARARAEAGLSLDRMVDEYLKVFAG